MQYEDKLKSEKILEVARSVISSYFKDFEIKDVRSYYSLVKSGVVCIELEDGFILEWGMRNFVVIASYDDTIDKHRALKEHFHTYALFIGRDLKASLSYINAKSNGVDDDNYFIAITKNVVLSYFNHFELNDVAVYYSDENKRIVCIELEDGFILEWDKKNFIAINSYDKNNNRHLQFANYLNMGSAPLLIALKHAFGVL